MLFAMLALGLNFLAHHDTEYGHIPLLAAAGSGLVIGLMGRRRGHERPSAGRLIGTQARLRAVVALAWAVPLASLLAAAVPLDSPLSRHPLVRGLIGRCRFAGVPCRRHRAAGPLVPRPHAGDRAVHRSSGPQDLSSLVAAKRRLQPGGEPLPCGGTGRLVCAIPGPRWLSRPARSVRAILPGRSSRLRGAVPGARRCRAGGTGSPTRCDIRGSRGARGTRRADRLLDPVAALSSCCTSRGITPFIGLRPRRWSSASGIGAGK